LAGSTLPGNFCLRDLKLTNEKSRTAETIVNDDAGKKSEDQSSDKLKDPSDSDVR
jgi:hypothetical protein